MAEPRIPDYAIDEDGWCLMCWEYCSNQEECRRNQAKNRDHVQMCRLNDPHPAHDWHAHPDVWFCKGRTGTEIPQALW